MRRHACYYGCIGGENKIYPTIWENKTIQKVMIKSWMQCRYTYIHTWWNECLFTLIVSSLFDGGMDCREIINDVLIGIWCSNEYIVMGFRRLSFSCNSLDMPPLERVGADQFGYLVWKSQYVLQQNKHVVTAFSPPIRDGHNLQRWTGHFQPTRFDTTVWGL